MPHIFEEVREELEGLGWPDGRSLKKGDISKRIELATDFLKDVKKPSQRLFCLYANLKEVPKCIHCGGDNKYTPKKLYPDNPYSGWSLFCSKACGYASEARNEKFKDTMLERHGVEYSGQNPDLLKKSRQTMASRYGADHPMRVPAIKRKFEDTMTERYGVKHSMSSPEIMVKIKNSMKDRYGVDHPSRHRPFQEKKAETWNRLYGVDHPMKSTSIRRNASISVIGAESYAILSDPETLSEMYDLFGNNCVTLADELNVHRSTVGHYLHRHGIEVKSSIHESKGEIEVREFISSLGFECHTDKEILEGKHIDILIPEKSLGIEFNGVYWHTTEWVQRSYHKEKTQGCIDKGIRLFHIWEDEWEDPIKRSIWENTLKISLGVYDGDFISARKTSVRECSFSEIREFVNKNHIQGAVGGSVHLGCFHEDTLVCVMTLSGNSGQWSLDRFCSSAAVRGGFSKLLSFFKKSYQWDEIITFADLGISVGDLYEKNGFEKVHITPPVMWYAKDGRRYRRNQFMKHKLPGMFENVDVSDTERAIMRENGYYQIFDSGLIKYSMKKKGA